MIESNRQSVWGEHDIVEDARMMTYAARAARRVASCAAWLLVALLFGGAQLFAGAQMSAAGALHPVLQATDLPMPGAEMTRWAALYFAFVGIYLLMGVVFFIFWRWLRRDRPMFSLAVFLLVMAVHSAAISGTLPVLFPALDAQTSTLIQRVAIVLLNGLIAWMLWAFFPHAFYPAASSRQHVFNSSLAGLAGLTSVAFAAAAIFVGAGEPLLTLSRIVTLGLMAVVVTLAGRTVGSHVEKRALTMLGLALLVAASVIDLLLTGPAGRPYVVPFAILLFVLLQSYVMIRRTAESTLRAQVSGRRLRREVDERTQELQAATEAAQTANLAKTEFVTAVTHELRTPLSSILGYVRLLREEMDAGLSEEHAEFLVTIEQSGDRLLNLVNKLLDLARIESGRVELELKPVDAGELVAQVRSELFPLAKEKRLYLEVDVRTETADVVADEQWLRVVLTDLVSNAIKYTSEGGVTVRIPDAESGAAFAIKVIDTGPGISEEFMPQLFERFSREDRARTDAPTGSGLGLTIVRDLVGLMGGEIRVESEVGVGSAFTVLLPAA